MKRAHIKKITIGVSLMSAALCFSACGINTGETPNTFLLENPGQEIDNSEANTEPTADDENQADGSDSDMISGAETDTSVSSAGSSVTVIMKTEDDVSIAADDGTVIYTITCSYPIVSIAGNEAATEKINENILSRVEFFNTATNESVEYAKEDYEYMLSEDIQPPMPYSSDLSYTVTRADDHVISFTENGYEYTGGAHGMPYKTGINYDANTGELLSFTDLSDDPDTFHADTLAYNQALAQTEYYSAELFNTDNITDGTLEEVLYADGGWYLSTSGLVFMSPPYALAPYAAGTLEFTIPYSELVNMGFKEQYNYTGRMIVELMENEPYSIDLNGDGQEDSISYYDEWVDDETDSRISLTHLTINGVDYSQDGTDDVREQLSSSLDMMDVYLYDLDVNDSYVEFATLSVIWSYSDENDNYEATYNSKFFRYTEDGSLIYLGQADVDVSDPTVSVSVPDLESGS